MLHFILSLLLASFTFTPSKVRTPTDGPIQIENPADCHVRLVNGKKVVNSACH